MGVATFYEGDAMAQATDSFVNSGIFPTAPRLLLAVVFGGIIGTERGKHGRAAGMRTHILVCIGATMTTLIGEYVTFVLGMSSDPVRIGAQVISGIGFLGAGMIMTRGGLRVKGLTTAAGLWATATIGLALGIGFYSAAIIAVFLVYTTNKVLPMFEKITRIDTRYIYEEINDAAAITDYICYAKKCYHISSVYIVPANTFLSVRVLYRAPWETLEATWFQGFFAVLKRV